MPEDHDPVLSPAEPALGEHACPKCGVEMEPINPGADGPPLQHLQLCPVCYLVTWSDDDGLHVRQGVPMKKGVDPLSEPRLIVGEPEKC